MSDCQRCRYMLCREAPYPCGCYCHSPLPAGDYWLEWDFAASELLLVARLLGEPWTSIRQLYKERENDTEGQLLRDLQRAGCWRSCCSDN